MFRWMLIVVGVLVAIGGVAYLIGLLLPRAHTARLEGVVARSPAEIAATIRDVPNYPAWRSNVVVKDVAPAADGITYVEWAGKHRISYRLTEPVRDEKFVARMTDPNLPFGGAWTITLAPEGADTRVAIQEDGEMRNPIFRLFARFVFGYTSSMKTYLENLGATGITVPTN